MSAHTEIVSAAKAVNANLAVVMSSMAGAPDGLESLMNDMERATKPIIAAVSMRAASGEKVELDLEHRLDGLAAGMWHWVDDSIRFVTKWRSSAPDDATYFGVALSKLRGSVNKLTSLVIEDFH